jgi:hypothetical protein
VAIAGYLGKSSRFDDAIADYSEAYADRVETQHRELQRAVADESIPGARTGERR